MNSREIVYRAIDMDSPPRVPICYYNRNLECSDTYMVGCAPAAGFSESSPGETEWGYAWTSLDGTMGQTHGYPLEDPSRVDTYVPPGPYAPGRLDHLPAEIEEHKGKFIKFAMGITGFNQATFLRGFENLLMDLYTDRALAERVMDIVVSFETGLINQAGRMPIDAVVFGDDWGTQDGLIISPSVWREVFLPRYASQFDLVHGLGKKVWFHSCGNIFEIIGDLIDAGVDVLELLQPDVMGVDRLASHFGGKVCFCCSVDHQRRAISGTKDEIFAYARLLNEKLGAFNGGFIAYIEDYSCLGMSEQNYQWIREAFHGLNAPS